MSTTQVRRLIVTSIASTEAHVAWGEPERVGDLTQYRVYVEPAGVSGARSYPGSSALRAVLPPTRTTYEARGLAPGTTYTLSVEAHDDVMMSGPTAQVHFTTQADVDLVRGGTEDK